MLATYLHSQGSVYFNSIEIQLPENASLEKLQSAWSNVVAKYEMLRTGFTNVDNSKHPFAMITYYKGVMDSSLNVVQGESSHSGGNLRERTRAISITVLKALHIPPWRIEAIRTRHKNLTIRLFLHHALFDAVSLRLILKDFEKNNHGMMVTPEVPIDSLLGQIHFQTSSDVENKEMFWKSYMRDVPATKFPVTTVLQIQSEKTNTLQKTCRISFHDLKEICQNIGVTVQSACQASWARVLSSYTGETSVRFGLGAITNILLQLQTNIISIQSSPVGTTLKVPKALPSLQS